MKFLTLDKVQTLDLDKLWTRIIFYCLVLKPVVGAQVADLGNFVWVNLGVSGVGFDRAAGHWHPLVADLGDLIQPQWCRQAVCKGCGGQFGPPGGGFWEKG